MTPREFDFEPRDHVELGRLLGAIDLERGAKVSGSRFYYLTGAGAELELALVNMAMDQARDAGFTPVIPPSLVKPRAMEGTGFLGQAADDVYRIEGEDLYLVGTSEVPMAAYHSDEILDADTLPLRYAAFSPCFRKEAGSHGKDTKGIIRVHWFDKVEMFVVTTLEESYAEHQRLLEWEKEFLDKLELAYRVIDVAAGDLGLSAQRKFDCEAWIPTQGKYRELTSTSNCTDFQAVGSTSGSAARRRHRPSPPSTARCARSPARSSRSWRRTSRRTDRCACPKPCGPTSQGLEVLTPSSPLAARWNRTRWQPRLVALDIDGTLLEVGRGRGPDLRTDHSRGVRRSPPAIDAGAHVVLSSGRSPHGMDKIADLLDLPRADADRIWVVASNGAVIFRYPPLEVVHEETFDAREAVRQVLQQHPEALVAVEERGIGYRVNRHFPMGELSGDMIDTDVARHRRPDRSAA